MNTNNIIFFEEDDSNERDSLPWVKEWRKSSPNPKDARQVLTIWESDRGLLLLTAEYKHFVFTRQKVFYFLKEALDVWTNDKKPVCPLVCCFIANKVQIGLSQDETKIIWHQDETKFYSVYADGTEKQLNQKGHNPFLTPNNPTQSPHADAQKKPSPKDK